jgi:CRP-like cAMP-binding protein
MDDLERNLRAHPFLADLEPAHLPRLLACARPLRFRAGEYLLREGDREDVLYLIRQGSVSIEMPRAGGEPLSIETLGPGDVLGVSLLTPAAAHLDCRARDTVVAIGLDNEALEREMDADPRLGYALSRRLLERTYQRLARARMQHLDLYR